MTNGMSENVSERNSIGSRIGGESLEGALGSLLLHTFCMTINLKCRRAGDGKEEWALTQAL